MAIIDLHELEPNHRTEQSTELELKFRFDLGGHELVDPTKTDGCVTTITEAEPVSTISGEYLPIGVRVFDVRVSDPFVAADPEGYAIVREHVQRMEDEMERQKFNPLIDRSEAQTRDQRNQFTRAWLAQPELESLSIWRDNVPTANALSYLTNPWVGSIVTNNGANQKTVTDLISPETAAHLRFVDDAVAIRDRAAAMQKLAEDHITQTHRPGEEVRWLSLASGTAEPSIKAANSSTEVNGVDVELTVVDYDGKALKFVQENAQKAGFGGTVNTIQANILAEDLSIQLSDATGRAPQYDVVENMGFEEYLPQDGDELAAKKGAGLPQASEFTRRAYDMVKSGGMLISGNMVLDRPQIGFVFGIVDWPIINARSEESILRVYKEAGILDDPQATVEMYRIYNQETGQRLYNIVKVTKA